MNNFSKNFTNKSPFKQEDPKNEDDLEYTTRSDSKMSDAEYAKYFSEGSIHRPNLDEVVVTAPRKKGKSLEHISEEVFNFPQEEGRRRTDRYLDIIPDKDGLMQEQNSFEYGDTARHYFTGDQLSRSIQDKFKFLPYPTKVALGIVGSNIGGWVHEYKNLKDGRPFLESVEDATNNFWGSLASLFSKDTSTKVLDKTKKYLPDGKVKS